MDAPSVRAAILFALLVCTSSLPTMHDTAAEGSSQQRRGDRSWSEDGGGLWAAHAAPRKRSAATPGNVLDDRVGAQPMSISPSPSISTESSGLLGPPFLETISSSGTILPSWTIVSLGTTPSQGTTSSATIVPTTSDPISSTPVPTMSSNSMTAIDPDTLVSGSNIGLKLLFTPNNNFYWIGCTMIACRVKNCPGNRFKPEKIALCPEYIFIISRTDGGSVIRVGDTVSLTQQGGGALYCGLSNPACLLSPNCRDSFGRFSTQLCANQVLEIRALNKVPGQPIMNNDNVVLDFFIGSLPVSGWMDNLNCHSEANGSCDRRYCLDNSVILQAGNTTLSTISPCRQLFTIFKLS